jgi:hypothetical protein
LYKASDEVWEVLTGGYHLDTPDSDGFDSEVNQVTLPEIVSLCRHSLFSGCGVEQRGPKLGRVVAGPAQCCRKHTSFVASVRVLWIQAVIFELSQVNDCAF